MAEATQSERATYFFAEVARFSRGIRAWQYEPGIHHAEIHYAAMKLLEDDRFAEHFRTWLIKVGFGATHPNLVDRFGVHVVPDIVNAFFNTLIAYLENGRGEMP